MDQQRRRAARRHGLDHRRRGLGGSGEPDPPDRSAGKVHVEEIPSRSRLQIHRVTHGLAKEGDCRRIGLPVRTLRHHPQALARVVPEKEGSLVGGRVARARVEGN